MVSRIRIIGVAGTGKTTLARKLAKILKCRNYELDDIYWKRKFDLKRPFLERRKLANKVSKKEKWIIEGGSSFWAKSTFKRADVILFLDAPMHKIAYRVIKRHIHRRILKKHRETLKDAVELVRYAHYKKNLPKSHPKSYDLVLKSYRNKIRHLHTNKQISSFVKNLEKQPL